MKITVDIKPFGDLTLDEFHDLIALRMAVFVVEQNCPYQDLDGKDKQSFHLIIRNNIGKTIGTARILPAGISYPEISIGRVASSKDSRKLKLGHLIMEKSMVFIEEKWGKVPVKLSAQTHLIPFYGKHGFVSTGKEYLEDEIPHTEMIFTN